MKIKIFFYILILSLINNNFGLILKLEKKPSESQYVQKWKYKLLEGEREIAHIEFEKNHGYDSKGNEIYSGTIDYFLIYPTYRGKNIDTILMYAALDKLFLDEDVIFVKLDAIAYGPNYSPNMDTPKLINYYEKKFGFLSIPPFKSNMILTRERFLKSERTQNLLKNRPKKETSIFKNLINRVTTRSKL